MLRAYTLGDKMTNKTRATYTAAIKLETAQFVLDQGYTQEEAAKAMGVGKSTVSKWVSQLKLERRGIAPNASPMTSEQIEIRELKKKIARIEMEKDILKKATALLMSDSLNSSR
ncbi:transposase [Shewanella sairae]|uniref:Transposase n=1 Tax=Shewanella sairae TaxID=190310 RepID=A0ABQ4PS17_9GAMM|nr:transposase [Shewanella sairae]